MDGQQTDLQGSIRIAVSPRQRPRHLRQTSDHTNRSRKQSPPSPTLVLVLSCLSAPHGTRATAFLLLTECSQGPPLRSDTPPAPERHCRKVRDLDGAEPRRAMKSREWEDLPEPESYHWFPIRVLGGIQDSCELTAPAAARRPGR